MEKYIKVNENNLLSNEHFVLTQRGLLKAKDLQIGDKVIGPKGESTIKNIVEWKKYPDTPIVGETNN